MNKVNMAKLTMNKYFMVKLISAKPFTKLHVNTNNFIEMGYVTHPQAL